VDCGGSFSSPQLGFGWLDMWDVGQLRWPPMLDVGPISSKGKRQKKDFTSHEGRFLR